MAATFIWMPGAPGAAHTPGKRTLYERRCVVRRGGTVLQASIGDCYTVYLLQALKPSSGKFFVCVPALSVCGSPPRGAKATGAHGQWGQNNVQSPSCDPQLHTGEGDCWSVLLD